MEFVYYVQIIETKDVYFSESREDIPPQFLNAVSMIDATDDGSLSRVGYKQVNTGSAQPIAYYFIYGSAVEPMTFELPEYDDAPSEAPEVDNSTISKLPDGILQHLYNVALSAMSAPYINGWNRDAIINEAQRRGMQATEGTGQ